MGQQIIRNVSTLDRGPVVRATTDEVLKVVMAYQGEFTTYDIARVSGIEEYPVRAAMSWLVKRGIVERIGTTERTLQPVKDRRLHGDRYTVALYRAKEEAAPVDFNALNRAFGFA